MPDQKPTKAPKMRADKERNRHLIKESIIKLLRQKKGKRMPSVREIAEDVGMNESTVKQHVKEIRENSNDYERYKVLTETMMLAIYKSGLDGASSSQKLFMEIVEGFAQRQEITGKDGGAMEIEVKPFSWFDSEEEKSND